MTTRIHCDGCGLACEGELTVSQFTPYHGEEELHFCGWACILDHCLTDRANEIVHDRAQEELRKIRELTA